MKIGLMGFEFVSPNKGCEALAYSFLNILKDICNDATIVVFTNIPTVGDAAQLFPEFRFEFARDHLKDYSFSMYRKMLSCDIIFDITMGDSFSDIYNGEKAKKIILKKRIAETLNSHYVLLPQTYGPFNIKENEKKALKVIKRAWKVYARDDISKHYIQCQEEGVSVKVYPDLAFFLPFDKKKFPCHISEKHRIGLNVSGLLWRGGFNSANQFGLKVNYKEYIKGIIQRIKNIKEMDLVLIPHVIDISDGAHDDDYNISLNISREFGLKKPPLFSNPIEAKSYIANCEVFIGARMHSTIAAYSSGVPTIPFSYSRKFEGLYNSIRYEYIVSGTKEDTNEAIEKTLIYVQEREQLKKRIEEHRSVIEDKKIELKNEIDELLKQIR